MTVRLSSRPKPHTLPVPTVNVEPRWRWFWNTAVSICMPQPGLQHFDPAARTMLTRSVGDGSPTEIYGRRGFATRTGQADEAWRMGDTTTTSPAGQRLAARCATSHTFLCYANIRDINNANAGIGIGNAGSGIAFGVRGSATALRVAFFISTDGADPNEESPLDLPVANDYLCGFKWTSGGEFRVFAISESSIQFATDSGTATGSADFHQGGNGNYFQGAQISTRWCDADLYWMGFCDRPLQDAEIIRLARDPFGPFRMARRTVAFAAAAGPTDLPGVLMAPRIPA